MVKIELQTVQGDNVTFSLSVSLSEFLGSFINSQRGNSSKDFSPSPSLLSNNFADEKYVKDFENLVLYHFDKNYLASTDVDVKECVKAVRRAVSSHPWGHYQAVLDVIKKYRKKAFSKKKVSK